MSREISKVDARLGEFIDRRYARRELRPLRELLRCYLMVTGLTNEWAVLATSLKTIRVQFCEDLADNELDNVVDLQHIAESLVYR